MLEVKKLYRTEFIQIIKEFWQQYSRRFLIFFILLLLLIGIYRIEFTAGSEMFADFWDAIWRWVITASTIGYGDKYPTTQWGQWLAVAYIIVSILLFGDLVSQITSYLLTKNQKKMTWTLKSTFRNHVIVYGKSSIETSRMLRQLSKEFDKIVFISSNIEIPKRILRMQSDGLRIERVSWNPDNAEILDLANVSDAVEFVLLHDEGLGWDKDMLMYVMNIKLMNEHVPIIVEISDENSRPLFEKAGCKTIINTQSLGKNLLVRSLTDDVHLIFDELLENDEWYEIYKCALGQEREWKTLSQLKKFYLDSDIDVEIIALEDGNKKTYFEKYSIIAKDTSAYIICQKRLKEI